MVTISQTAHAVLISENEIGMPRKGSAVPQRPGPRIRVCWLFSAAPVPTSCPISFAIA